MYILMEKGKPETQRKSLGAKREQQQTHPIKYGAGIITKLINLSTDRTAFFLFGSEGDSEQAKHFVGISPSHCKVYGETEKFFLKLPSDKNVTVHNYLPS